jgi:isopenicillin N synthase-like dioxygenase
MATTNGHTGQIPVIDISGPLPESEIAEQLVDAAATYGFVYVKNEGKDIPVEAIDSVFDLVRDLSINPILENESTNEPSSQSSSSHTR